MVMKTERMLALQKQSSRTPQEQEMVKREIESMDKAIDRLVYELSSTGVIYGMSEETPKNRVMKNKDCGKN